MIRLEKNSVTVSAPSRLHFGLVSIGDQTTRKFGGAGVMIDQPRTRVSVSAADRFSIEARDPEVEATVRGVAERWHQHFASEAVQKIPLSDLPFAIDVGSVPRHAGFGSGTQLAFTTIAALQTLLDLPLPSAEETAIAMKRGTRSAIGSYGFLQGGFLVDRGIGNEAVAPLDLRVDFPKDWPIVLIQKLESECDPISGEAEIEAFANLKPTTQQQADEMTHFLKQEIVPGILSHDFEVFAAAVTEFGRRSGLYYDDVQGGAYADPWAKKIVDRVNELGTYAVGQSSWGPTLFAICRSEFAANELVARLVEKHTDHRNDMVGCRTSMTRADNRGAVISSR